MNIIEYNKFFPGKYYGPWEDSYPDDYEDGYGEDDFGNEVNNGEEYIELDNGKELALSAVSSLWDIALNYEKSVKIAEEDMAGITCGEQYAVFGDEKYTKEDLDSMEIGDIYYIDKFDCSEPEPDYDDYDEDDYREKWDID